MLTHLLADTAATFWLPEQASNFAAEHDFAFYFIYWVSVIAFVVGGAVSVGFAIRYRRKSPDQRTHPLTDHIPLELTWTIIPTIIFIFMFVIGFRTFIKQSTPPANAMEIRVSGYKWFWEYRYPNGETATRDLYVPIDTPVRLLMSSEATSKDDAAVLHSFFVPAFRIKRDLLPYHYTVMWFEATRLGSYHIFCAEYCGTGHSKMIGTIHVVPQDEFEEKTKPAGWDADKETLAEFGQRTFGDAGCTACHTTTGEDLVGPTLQGLYMDTVTLETGETVEADENYLRESIMDPQAKIVDGYTPSMPTYAGRLNDEQVDGLIDFIKSLE